MGIVQKKKQFVQSGLHESGFGERLPEQLRIRGDRPIDRLVCNAAVYQPTLAYPKWTVDGHEQQLQINYLSHFLLLAALGYPFSTQLACSSLCIVRVVVEVSRSTDEKALGQKTLQASRGQVSFRFEGFLDATQRA